VYLRSYVRDALNQHSSQYTVEDINGKGKTDLIAQAEKSVRDKLVDKGIVLERLYWVNSPRPPTNVIAEINNKVAAVQIAQRKENEVQAAQAQAQINKLNNGSMSTVTIRMKELDNQAKAIDKWNGQLPSTMPPGSTLPFLDVRGSKDKD
jgi:regulator of protease activity HflC (stomatin/prohibitin superfamily)